MKTWAIVGASRGIGLEFVRQLLAEGNGVLAAIRDQTRASQLWAVSGASTQGACRMVECDITSPKSIDQFVIDLVSMRDIDEIDYVVLNAGILKYPNRATEMSFETFEDHLRSNTVGPIIVAQKLLQTKIKIGTIVFMSSDSGSAANFREFEDGFAAYAASKAALNQALRHMAAELQRKGNNTTILAMHPGEVATDMANVELDWEVEGIITPQESVSAMLKVIRSKTFKNTGTFWTWEGREYPW